LAFNIHTFKTRALTALLFVVVMLVGLLWNFWSFLILFTIIHFGCLYEFVKLMKKIYGEKYLGYCLFGLIYITLPILMLISLAIEYQIYTVNNMPDKFVFSSIIPCGIIFSIWINDTMAYLVGSFIGKTPLTKISPKKTWEGTVGGIILCVIAIGILYPLIIKRFSDSEIMDNIWFAIPAICAIFGTLGDLLESKLKRMANVKDSGSFMPGHGGFLDRFDSLLVAVPAVWVYVFFFIK
jgi:phosphatidate cytidylyltransferase